MATGTRVEFKKGEKPSTDKVLTLVEDYFGRNNAEFKVDPKGVAEDWLIATLPGRPSNMLERQDHTSMTGMKSDQLYPEERWVELCCIDPKVIEVMARHGDEFAKDVERALARRLAGVFGGAVLGD